MASLFTPRYSTNGPPMPQIFPAEIRDVVLDGEFIEDYTEDARGNSCLMLGTGHGGRAVHVVCSPKEGYLAIITAYLPDGGLWSDDYRKRIKP